ncbi:hypothetical protein DSM112329_03131 [Paraconexibacter sp. AEG42_29]|uniref:Transmembrane protein (PGPGW) n=1 Tax=Paraconexibacter sp. AEG42_29 TaxID=2997339 RepID=A0AAU7AX15_9ACTN
MTDATDQADSEPVVGDDRGIDAANVPVGGRRHRLRTNPVTRHPYRIAVFVLGLLCIATGIALAVLPGPLTIPPVLLGLWIWSWEFRFAQKFFESFQEKAHEAWAHAKRRPVTSAIGTGFGLILAGVAMWAVIHYDLVAEAQDRMGL